MNKDDLIELRELFRVRMRQQDFCIGEYEVEKVFRELLNEPEPEFPPYQGDINISSDDISKILTEYTEHITDLFERDSAFYNLIKNKK